MSDVHLIKIWIEDTETDLKYLKDKQALLYDEFYAEQIAELEAILLELKEALKAFNE